MLTVIGCGNLNRRDDGVGVVVAQRLDARLRRHPVPGVQVYDCGTAGIDVMFKARGTQALLIVDAARSGSEPGTIFDVPGEELAQDHQPTYSLHDFRWDHALAAGRRIYADDFPSEVRVLLIEVESTELGLELSEPVRAAADTVYDKILRYVAEYATRRHRTGADETLELERGSIRLSKDVYDRFFDGMEGVLLLERDGRICLVPVEQAIGGLLVKQRNRRGDRVIHAAEFLQAHGIDDARRDVPVSWEPTVGGLAFELKP